MKSILIVLLAFVSCAIWDSEIFTLFVLLAGMIAGICAIARKAEEEGHGW